MFVFGQVTEHRRKVLRLVAALFVMAQGLAAQGVREAGALTQETERLYAQGKYAEAIPIAEQALAIIEKSRGRDHPDTAASLNNLAALYQAEGAYEKAEPLYQRALAILEKALGPNDPNTASCLNNLAMLYHSKGDYPKAEPLYQRALAINEKALGPNHPGTATSVNNLAELYRLEGLYQKAEPLYQRALAILEKALGRDHPDTVASLNNLAILYQAEGAYPAAEPLLQRALAINEKAFGPDHPQTATSLNNLVELYRSEGLYQKAEPLDKRALAIQERALGPNHPSVAVSLNNLAILFYSEGAYQKAEPLYQRALAIDEKALGPDHAQTATDVNNLAGLYHSQGAYQKAEPLYQRALALQERALGPNHPAVAASLNNLAALYELEGAYQKAEPLFQRALAIKERSLGLDHPDTATSLNNLAALYDAQGAYQKAEPLYQRALVIQEQAFGPVHPKTAATLNNLAALYKSQGAYQKAKPLYQRALAILEEVVGPDHPDTLLSQGNLALFYCEIGAWNEAAPRLASVIGNRRNRWDLSFGRDSQRQHVMLDREGLMTAIYKGSLLSEQRQTYLPLLLETILASKARVTEEERVVLEMLNVEGTNEDRTLIQELQDTIKHASVVNQRGPGTHSLAEYRNERQQLELNESDLRAKLSARSAEFRALTDEPSPSKVAATLRNRVLVEIVRTRLFRPTPEKQFGNWLYAALVLFPDGHIDMAELGPAKPIDDLIATYRQAQEVLDNRRQAEALADKLGDLILAPIAKMAGSYKEWWVAPDGEIRQLPLNALRLNGKYAVESYKIWPIGSGRDILTLDSHIERGRDDLIIANPDFGAGSAFTALSETEDEAESIREALPNAKIVEPANRTKSFLLNLTTAPRILHLSTHAFYHAGEGDPTLRSGIALKGANVGAAGILTAKEAQTLRLRGTQMVVMSACDTGVGEVSFGDGLIGLQRSLTLAGARTQVLTEWPVNSAGTREFMVRFYSKLAGGKTKGDAWIETQREMIAEGVSPHFWAPFVLYGDPGPLGEK